MVPLSNTIIFSVLSAVAFAGLLTALVCFTLRDRGSGRRFIRQKLLFAHGFVFMCARVANFYGLAGMQGVSLARLEAARMPTVTLSLTVGFGALLLTLSVGARVSITTTRVSMGSPRKWAASTPSLLQCTWLLGLAR